MQLRNLLTSLALAATSSAAVINRDFIPVSSSTVEATFASVSASASYLPKPETSAGFNETMYEEFKVYAPKVLIVNMFSKEANVFLKAYDFVHNITIPGLSQVYNEIHCDKDYELCQLTTGEGEINAATSITALSLNPTFDLTKTFFLIAGIAGISPKQGTINDVTFARFAVQMLEYEVDAREIPEDWASGYFPFGTTNYTQYPTKIYGSEVFELNVDLRDRALELAQTATLANGSALNNEFRLNYNFAPANRTPQAIACDTLTSDTYWFGQALDNSFSAYTSLMSNGTATYCTSQQEDNATLEALIRAGQYGLIDFSRIVVMRSASDFTYSEEIFGRDTVDFFTEVYQGGTATSLVNLVYASEPFIADILDNFETYDNGTYAPSNYIGDFFNSLEDDIDLRLWGNPKWSLA